MTLGPRVLVTQFISSVPYPKILTGTIPNCDSKHLNIVKSYKNVSFQVYFQRVLSSKSASKAELTSYIAAFGCIIMAVPPVLIGGIAKVVFVIQLLSNLKQYQLLK